MDIFLDFIKYLEASVMTSVSLFCIFVFLRTKDSQIGRIIFVVVPSAILLFISFSYSYLGGLIHTYYPNEGVRVLGNVASLLSIITVFMIGITVLGIFMYFIALIKIDRNKIKVIMLFIIPLFVAFIIFGIYFDTVIAKNYFNQVEKTNWIFFAFSSLVPFICAIILVIKYKYVEDKEQGKLYKYFIISFLPQIIYSLIDIFLLESSQFQLSNLSYLVFSLLSFYYISGKYFHLYDLENPKDKLNDLKTIQQKYDFSDREMDLIPLLIEGSSNDKISKELYISINTVKTHVKNIYKKANVTNRVQLLHEITSHPNR